MGSNPGHGARVKGGYVWVGGCELTSFYLDVVELKNVLRMASVYGNHLRQRSHRVATEQV